VKFSKILAPLVLYAGLSLAQSTTPPDEGAHPSGPMTGCLTKGNASGEYILTTDAGKQTSLVSTEDLSKHIDHKVKVTGTATKQQEKPVLRVENVEHVADSCK
jgi:hypothetical protein